MLTIHLPLNSDVPFLAIYSGELEINVPEKAWPKGYVFRAALFIMYKNWKEPAHPRIQLWCIQERDHCSVRDRSNPPSHNMCDSHKRYTEKKKPNEGTCVERVLLQEVVEWAQPGCGDRNRSSGYLWEGGVIRKRHNKFAAVMDTCWIFGQIVAARMSALAKTHGLNI